MCPTKKTKSISVNVVAAIIGGVFVIIAAIIQLAQPLVGLWGEKFWINSQPTEALRSNTQLGYIQNGDVWLKDIFYDTLTQLTNTGDVSYFSWSPDGKKLFIISANQYCIIELINLSNPKCTTHNLNARQIEKYKAVWSFDLKHIVIWLDDFAAGKWIIVTPDESFKAFSIDNPYDWGVTLDDWELKNLEEKDAQTFMGSPAFTKDGRLFGTIGNILFCGAGGCSYRIYEFDFVNENFYLATIDKNQEYLDENLTWVNPYLSVSSNGKIMWFTGNSCDQGSPCIPSLVIVNFSDNIFVLNHQLRDQSLINELMDDPPEVSSSPDGTLFAISTGHRVWEKTVFCLNVDRLNFPIQILDYATDTTREIVGGYDLAWSPDGKYLAFESCLAKNQNGTWAPVATSPIRIFVVDLTSNELNISPLIEGIYPSWRPKP